MAYPNLQIDYLKYPDLADNIWHAQKAGHPKVLTYGGRDAELRRATRRKAMHYDVGGTRYEIPHVESRDEYPFACTLEGGESSWVGHIPARQNCAQGGVINAFLQYHHIEAGRGELSKFTVTVINHPGGPA